MYGGEDGAGSFDDSKTKITSQQKCKFAMHWIILVVGHLFIFWYIPIHGNLKMYGQPQCNQAQVEDYGCKDFHNNFYVRILYLLVVIYLVISSL